MQYVLASDPLAPFGQAGAIILAIYMFVWFVIALALSAALMFAFAWVRQKSEVLKKLRPMVDKVNTTTRSAMSGTLSAAQPDDKQMDKIVRTLAVVPESVHEVDKKVEATSDRVARAVIEFRARTMMVKGMAKAFFLPGLTRKEPRSALEKTGVDFKSPGYRMLMEQAAPEGSTAIGDGYVGAVSAQQLKAVGSAGVEEPQMIVTSSSGEVGAEQLRTLEPEEVKDASLR